MKNVSKSKFLLCFRPDSMLESKPVVVNRPHNHRALRYVAGAGTGTITGVRNKEEPKPSTTNSSVSNTKNSITVHRGEKKTFSQVIKAVVFEIILAKKVRDRKSSDELENSVFAGKGIQGTISSSSSSLSLSTPNLMQKPEIKQNDEEPKQEGIYKGFSSSNNVISLLLIGLAMTIFWGKFCAIIFTSIWLYFLPRQHKQTTGVDGKMETIRRIPEKDSRDRKKGKQNREGIKFLT